MTMIMFLAEWALRSSVLIACGALLLRALRVKDSSLRLAAWTAMLCGSLLIPALTAALPGVPFTVARMASARVKSPAGVQSDTVHTAPVAVNLGVRTEVRTTGPAPGRVNWARSAWVSFGWTGGAVTVYVLVALWLLLRLCVGLTMSFRLRRGSRATERATGGIEIRESDGVDAPVTLGIVRPVIVLPVDWRQWDAATLEAVLAHERSHVRRHDPAVQLLSAIHRALLWHNPLSWFLHRRIVCVAEDASDDAAIAATRDRASYAEALLDFMRRGVRGASSQGIPMARYGQQAERIQRILDGAVLSRGVTRWGLATILALGAPLACLVAMAHPQSAAVRMVAAPPAVVESAATKLPVLEAPPIKPPRLNSSEAPASAPPCDRGLQGPHVGGRAMRTPQAVAQSPASARQEPGCFLEGIGTVVASSTVTVKPRVDGQLMSVNFNEGEMVQAGQLLATIDPRSYQIQVNLAQNGLSRDRAQLAAVRAQSTLPDSQNVAIAQLEGSIKADRANLDSAQLQLSYTQVAAPITGVAGLRLVDPGNMVHASDSNGIVIITQIQPIAVVFTLPEDRVPQVLALMKEGASVPVEAWSRDERAKIATGHLTAVDNQIDETTGTIKLKAVFDNEDGALFPNQFVNMRLLLTTQ